MTLSAILFADLCNTPESGKLVKQEKIISLAKTIKEWHNFSQEDIKI